MLEASVQRLIWRTLGAVGMAVLFRCNTGKGWVSGGGQVQRLPDGTVALPFGRPVALGLSLVNGDPQGGVGDLIGWTTVEVTPAMVGRRLAVFTSVETKRLKRGRVSDDQLAWADRVRAAGGIAVIANSEEFARLAFDEELARLGAVLPQKQS